MSHPSHDDLAAYALGALDGRELRAVSGHVEGCERCETELADRLTPALDVLAESVEQLEPPASLRQSLMATVHEEARAEAPAAAPRRERSRLGAFLMRPAAGLAVLALGAAGVTGYLVAEDGGAGVETVPVESALSPQMGGSLEIQDDGATLKVHGMPVLSKGEVYQVWVAQGEAVVPSATFVPHDDGTATAAVPEATGDFSDVMVTREPRPGRRAPTLPPVLDARVG